MSNFIMLDENLIDLSIANTPANVLLELANILEKNDLRGRRIKLILGDILFTPENIFSLKSILEHSDAKLEVIYTRSLNTQLAALSAGLIVSEQPNTVIEEEEVTETVDAVDELITESIETCCSESADQYETERVLEEFLDKETVIQETVIESQDYRTRTLYLKQTLRSGQTVNYDGNIVIIGDSHPGSEIIASGDITVWGILTGIAHAGAKNDSSASIRALKINAIQLRIADLFARKPDRLELEKVERTSSFIPEEARISNGEIKIYSLNG